MATDVIVDGRDLCNGVEGVQKCRRPNKFNKKLFTTLVVHIAKHNMIEILLTKEGKLVEEEVYKIRIRIINYVDKKKKSIQEKLI